MEMNTLFAMALGITEPWYIESVNFDAASKRLDIRIGYRRGSTFRLAGVDADCPVHDTREKQWRHLDFFQHECVLTCKVPRVKTPDGDVRQVQTPWEGRSNGFTLLFEALLMQLLKVMPVAAVARIAGVSDDKLWRMMEKYVSQARAEEDMKGVTAVGVDETSCRKGHNYITIFADLDNRRVIHVADGKGGETFSSFRDDLAAHGGAAEKIREVSMDMSPAFIAAAKETLPAAQRVFDHFHVIKLANQAVDQVRREEVKTEKSLSKLRYVFMKNRCNLKRSHKEILEDIESRAKRLKTHRAMIYREDLQDAYKSDSIDSFRSRLQICIDRFCRSRLAPFVKLSKTLRQHFDGIAAFGFRNRSNGLLEGLNSLIQSAKSKARGYRTLRNFKLIVYMIVGKLDFARVNMHIKPT